MKVAPLKIAVIGAGWAGCAAAAELTRKKHQVTLFESARTLGGRARLVETDGRKIDNGQHILLGAYAETLRVMRMVGIDLERTVLRLPLQMRYPPNSGGMDFAAPRLPAPFHLLAALWRTSGLEREDKMALARFSSTARWMGWQLNSDCSVIKLLEQFQQTERLTKLMWRPLCIAALNTPPERASAQVFLNVLRDSLGAKRAASDMLIPRVDLTALFPKQAAAYVEACGGIVKLGASVKSITRRGAVWQLEAAGDSADEAHAQNFDKVIVATQASHASALLGSLMDVAHLNAFEYEPITTCYLQYLPDIRLERPFFALIDDGAINDWGQFVFDRGQLDPVNAGLLAVVVSASSEAIEMGQLALGAAVGAQLAKVFARPELGKPTWVKIISEKRATFACTPGLVRPENSTGIAGIFLAGDYTVSDYPATLEAAVRSGVKAAQAVA
ncbi:hydroxysqualene dehydroxylase HpnE [soil metagenome]